MILRTILNTLKRYEMLREGPSLVVAVSGGPDSVVLLHTLARLARSLELQLTVAHLDHGLRGEESMKDALFVRRLASSLDLPYLSEYVDVGKASRHRRIPLEQAGREIRYDFLKRAAKKAGARTVATGHTLDDQAETVLLRLLRGAGPEGLAGIHPVLRRPGWPMVIRPLIEISRTEIVRYLESHGLVWRKDSSNLDLRFWRNRIRHELLPTLSTYNPRIKEALARTAHILREEDCYMDRQARQATRRSIVSSGSEKLLDPGPLFELDHSLRRRVLRKVLRQGGYPPGYKKVNSLLAWLSKCRKDTAALLPLRQGEDRAKPFYYEVDVNAPARIGVPGTPWTIRLELLPREKVSSLSGCGSVVHLSDAIRSACLVVRNRREGDRFHPLGAPGSRSVKRYFIDRKVIRKLRDKIPILVADERIAWIAGCHIEHSFRVRGQVGTLIQASVEGLDLSGQNERVGV